MMKIQKETKTEMVLKESGIIHIVLGLVFAVLGGVMLFLPDIFESGAPPWWAGAIFLAVGLGIAFLVKGTTEATIDKSSGKLAVSRKGLILKGRKEYLLSAVEEVELRKYYETTRTSKGGRQTKMNVEVSIMLKGGGREVLSRSSSSGLMTTFQSGGAERNLAERIAKFIGVPFKDRRPPTAQEALEAIQKGIEKGMEKRAKG